MRAPPDPDLLLACRVLFGADLPPAFLGTLQRSGLRAAWRRAALATHPDRVTDPDARRRHAERFIEARRAYGLLQDFLGGCEEPTRPAAAGARGPRRHRPAGRRAEAHPATRPLPRRRLRLGEFLYHSRVISYAHLIEAIVWQRRQRERFCEIGLRWRCLSPAQARALLAARRPHERVGAAAERLRLLNPFQVRAVLAFQRSRQRPLGGYFVERGVLSPAQLLALLRRLEEHNAALPRR